MTTIAKKMLTATAAALCAIALTAGIAAAAERGDRNSGVRQPSVSIGKQSGNTGVRKFDNNRGRQFNNANRGRQYSNRGHRGHRYGRRIGIPSVVILSGESSGCSYSYRKWQATGSRYWRARYNDCRNG